MQDREIGYPHRGAGTRSATRAGVGAPLNRVRSLKDVCEDLRQLAPPALVELQGYLGDTGGHIVEAAVRSGSCSMREDLAQGLAGQPAAHRNRQPLPVRVVDERTVDGAIEVLDRSASWLCPRQLDPSEVAQHASVVADRGERVL